MEMIVLISNPPTPGLLDSIKLCICKCTDELVSHDLRNLFVDLMGWGGVSVSYKEAVDDDALVTKIDLERKKKHHGQLTSVSSIESCADITLSTFFLLLSCISPANNSSSRIKYAFWKLNICKYKPRKS